ncbi:MAG: mdtE 1 [Mucilaginibacter sp.]|nr:mdtE 1 [Mucilaginibacter sp.]
MKNKKINIIVYSNFLLLTVLAASCGNSSKDTKAAPVNPPLDVQAVVLSGGQVNAPVTVPGQLVPYNNVELYAKENSYVKVLNVDIGNRVKKGQLLITLEAPEMIAQYNQAEADMNTKLATYKGSMANYERLKRTSQTPGTISPNDLDLALAKASGDSAQWKASQSSFRQTAELLNYLTIRAPFDGVVTLRNVSPGAYVGPGDKSMGKPLLVLQEQNKLRLTMSITEEYTRYLDSRDTVGFTVRALPGHKFIAHISRMAGGIDPQTRTEKVEMDVDNTNHMLLPQMYADVNLVVKADQQGFAIPRTALVMSAERMFVIKIVNKKAVWVDVKKGLENATTIMVNGSLKAGDTLVTNATEEIRNGTALNITSK